MADRARVWSTVATAALQVVVPILGYAQILGRTTGAEFQIAKTPLVPAGYAFSIWSVIFATCALYAIEQARPSRRSDPVLRRMGWPMAAAMGVNAAWSALAQIEIPLPALAPVLALGVVAALTAASRLFGEAASPVDWRVASAVGLLAGWVTVAVFANLSVALADLGLDWPGHQPQAVGLLSTCGLLACAVLWRVRGAPTYLAAVVWGLVALVVANLGREHAPVVAATAGAWIVVAAAAAILAWRRRGPATA